MAWIRFSMTKQEARTVAASFNSNVLLKRSEGVAALSFSAASPPSSQFLLLANNCANNQKHVAKTMHRDEAKRFM